MGTYAELYHHVSARTLVPALNEWRRMWGVASHTAWVMRRHELGIGDGEVPVGTTEIDFAGSTNSHPCNHSLTWVEDFLRSNQLPALYACFGYPSYEPEDLYRAPEWPAVRVALASLLDALRASDHATPDRPDALHPRVHFTGPTVERCIELVSGFVELAEWVLSQPAPDEYFMCWSW